MTNSKTATEQFAQLLEDYGDECDLWGAGSTRACKMFGLIRDKYEQAIAATLGVGECAQCAKDMGAYADSLCDPLKECINKLLRCLENDWHISASWDGLRKFWCIELTEDGVKLRDATHGTLTAEQVREAIFNGSSYASYDGAKYYADGIGMQAIADELNATLGSGECEIYRVGNTQDVRKCSACGKLMHFNHPLDRDCLNYCPNCGRKVVDE